MKLFIRRKMRYLLILALFLIPTVASATNYDTKKLNLNFSETTLEKVLNEICRQVSLLVVYSSDDLQADRKVTIHAANETLSSVMGRLFAGTQISYSIKGNNLVLFKKGEKEKTNTKKTSSSGKRFVTGTVKDANGEPMIGVSVLVSGTNAGTSTDIDGNFSIAVNEAKPVLEITYIGFEKETIPVDNKTNISVSLKEKATTLEEVVVTAMGIEREAKSLTYATQTIKNSEITRAKDANLINSLQGKSAGLVITPNTGGAGGSSKILLRGNSSILGNNQAMIVVDGVPLAERGSNQITDALLSGGNGRDGGDGMSNINPDDIESMTVLKGANAAALYGSRAANGVIIITTKKGKEGTPRIELSSSLMFESALVTPKYQNSYGATISEINPGDKTWLWANSGGNRRLDITSWGQRIGTYSQDQLNGIPYAGNQAFNNVQNFFETGFNLNNSLSVSTGTKTASTYVSYNNTEAKGITPNNTFRRHMVTLRQTVDLFDGRVSINASASYTRQKAKNRPGSGVYANGMYDAYLMPRNANIGWFKDNYQSYQDLYWINAVTSATKGEYYPRYSIKGNVQIWPWADQINRNNPYWTFNNLNKQLNRDRLMGALGIKGKIIDGLTAEARLKVDYSTDVSDTKSPKGMNSPTGFYESIYEYSKFTSEETFADVLINYNKKITDYAINLNLGASTQRDTYRANGFNYWMNGRQFLKKDPVYTEIGKDADGKPIYSQTGYTETEIITATPNVFDPASINTTYGGASTGTFKTSDEDWTNAVYAALSLGFKDWAFLDASIRTDWSRTYTQFSYLNNPDHYSYYSIGGNVILTDALKIKSEKLNNLKARISYSEVGNSIPNMNYGGAPTNWGSSVATASAFRDFTQARPETMRSLEFGIDGSFF